MYIAPVDDKNIVSFVHGYELGTDGACDLSTRIRNLIAAQYGIAHRSDGWPGQVARLAVQWDRSWVTTFKRVGLEIVTASDGGLDDVMVEILKSRILDLIETIDAEGRPWCNGFWTENWLSLCSVESPLFKRLWTEKEWMALRGIDELVQAGKVFREEDKRLLTKELLVLKGEFEGG